MAAVTFLLLAGMFLSTGINGKRVRTPCSKSSLFRCDDGYCISRHNWCANGNDCGDGSDEAYCERNPWFPEQQCDSDIHFSCENGCMCIPIEGYCDGYSSCPDQSDEKDCPCEELHEDEGTIEYEAYIGSYQTHQKCWKIAVNKGQYVELNISATFYTRDCQLGNVTLFTAGDGDADYISGHDNVICSNGIVEIYNGRMRSSSRKTYRHSEETLIRYRSNYYASQDNSEKDFLEITYKKVDDICGQPDTFKCTASSCISTEKRCDGIRDCANGLDEYECDYAVFASSNLEANRKKAVEWIKNQHDGNWGWKENTHRAVVALHLADGLNTNGSNKEGDLIAKQLELEVSTFLLRSKTDKRSPAELSAYINALLVICHDPRNFYGFDLVDALREELETVSGYEPPFPYLTLCNAKEPIPEDAVDRLLKLLQNFPAHGFVLEIQALAVMAVSCAIDNNNQYAHLKQNITDALDSLKKEQMQDGSFGNTYTTALVLQALIANNQEILKDWNTKSAVQFLRQKQSTNGSFDDFLATYLVLPVLNGKTLLDVGKMNCTEPLRRPKDGGVVSDIRSRLGGKTVVKYSLYLGDEKDQIHPIVLRTHENITVLELMELAADIDPKYKFKTHQVKNKTFIYEILNTPNNPESNEFWFMYQDLESGTIPMPVQSPDKVHVHKNHHIIMWYKTLNSV